jgi:hypothetical protein
MTIRWVVPILELVPVDADVDEAEDVAAKDGQHWQKVVERGAVRYLQFQDHDGDDDGDDAVAECFKPAFSHRYTFYLLRYKYIRTNQRLVSVNATRHMRSKSRSAKQTEYLQ